MSSKTSFRRFFLAHDTPRPMDQLARKNSLSKRNLNMSPLRIFRTERPCDADSFKNQKYCMTSFILIFYLRCRYFFRWKMHLKDIIFGRGDLFFFSVFELKVQ